MERKLLKLAFATFNGLLDCIEIVISDHSGKRPRRSKRTITRRQRNKPQVVYKHIYKAVPVIVRVGETIYYKD